MQQGAQLCFNGNFLVGRSEYPPLASRVLKRRHRADLASRRDRAFGRPSYVENQRPWLGLHPSSSPSGTDGSQTRRWRKPDSNSWSRFEKSRPYKTRYTESESFGRREQHHSGGTKS